MLDNELRSSWETDSTNAIASYMSIRAYKVGKTAKVRADDFAEALSYDDELSATWNSNPETSTDLLVATNLGEQGDGTELYIDRIPHCKVKSKPAVQK